MKELVLTFLLLVLSSSLVANHIVGGEIEFIYLSDGEYRINLIQYFDEAQNLNRGAEETITIVAFRKSDDALVFSYILPLLLVEPVSYTNEDCAIDELITSRVIWSKEIRLDPTQFADEEGYYIVWERCCRNANIKNIEAPLQTGMTYVLDIPPLMKDGKIFKNSSPILFKPLSDYACVGQLYYVDFTGTDPDGDSLVYSLTVPLNSSAAVAVPTPSRRPHGEVFFENGFSKEQMIPGSPSLRISAKGLLTVKPSTKGLYVFAVLVEEYRNGQKIGQTRRDFQMLVIDGCQKPTPPIVDIEVPGDPDFNPDLDTLRYTVAA